MQCRIGGGNEQWTLMGAEQVLVVTVRRGVAVGWLGTGKEGGMVRCRW